MPNIVYVLTNPAMPGLVKIGMTDRDDVKRRMSDLYTTGVPLPFECLAAREIEDREAADIEKALHTAFGPNRVNSSREFFQIDPEQVQALLRVMPGRDVTPKTPEPDAGAQDEDQAAADEYKKRQARTNELEFMESLNEHGMVAYRRVLALGDQEGMRIRWGTKGFSLNVVSDGAHVPVCFGYPPSAYNQQIYTEFSSIVRKSNVPQGAVDALRQEALNTGLFRPAGKGTDLSCQTHLTLDESQLDALSGWLALVIDKIREYEGVGDPQGRRFQVLEVVVDTGSTYTAVPREMLQRLGVPVERSVPSETADGRLVPVDVGRTTIRLEGLEFSTPVIFAEDGEPSLLGVVSLEEAALAVDPLAGRLIPANLLRL